MKKIIAVVPLLYVSVLIRAQTFTEWFEQKKTQINYLVEQITALQVYATYVEKGYAIADKGLKGIGSVKKADFTLHENHFTSMGKVNPQIKSYWKIAAITSLQIKIVQACRSQKKKMDQSRQFTGDEMTYASKVFNNLLDECANIIDQLIMVTTDAGVQMKDDERIQWIDQLYDKIVDRYEFVQDFGSKNIIMGMQRMKDQKEINSSRSLFDIE